jgi:inorganic phosphate transporter, PiT family
MNKNTLLNQNYICSIGADVRQRVVKNIFMSWIITLPAGAFLSMTFYFALKGMLG